MGGSCGCGSGVSVIQEIKVLASASSLQFNNGLTFTVPNLVQLGGPLLQDTVLNGNFNLTLGQSSNRLTSLSINTNTSIGLNFNNGTVGNSLTLSSTGVLLTDTTSSPKGLVGNADYSVNYTNLTYTQKVYVDNRIGGKAVSSLVTTPTVIQNGYVLSWDNTNQRYNLVPSTVNVPGSNTQVIFNNAGNFGAISTVTWTTGNFTVDDTLTIGQASTSVDKVLTVRGSTSDVNLNLVPINNGSLNIRIKGTGVVSLGLSSDAATVRKITAISSNAQTDISLEPTGQNGVIYFGDSTQAGATRYISPNGTATNISIVLKSKGTGDLIADGGNFLLGLTSEANTSKQIKVQSNTNASLILTPAGTGRLLIGDPTSNTSDQYIQATNSTGNVNLNVMSNGTGNVNLRGTLVNAYGDINLVNVRLGVSGSYGSSGQVFTSNGSSPPSWQTPATGYTDPLTTIGDLLYRNLSNTTTRLPVGSNGQYLTISSGVPTWGGITGLLSGLTATRVPFANSATVLVDDAALTWDNGNKILSVGNGTQGIVSVNTASGVNVIRTYIASTLEFYINNSTANGSVFVNVNNRPISFSTGGSNKLTINASGSIAFNSATGISGQLLQSNGSGAPPTWVTFTGTPAGANTQLQFNNSGVFGASQYLVWDSTNKVLQLSDTNIAMRFRAVSNPGFGTGSYYINSSVTSPSTSANDNIAFGDIALTAVSTGAANTIIGMNSGGGITSGIQNTIIGFANAINNLTTGQNNIIIGNNLSLPTPNGSNQINIGNVFKVNASGAIIITGVPTSSAGLPSGAIWNNSGVLNIVP